MEKHVFREFGNDEHKFISMNGLLGCDSFNKLKSAVDTIHNCLYLYPSSGVSVDDIDYVPVINIYETERAREALKVLDAYFNPTIIKEIK